MIEISTSILTVEKGKEAETFFTLEKSTFTGAASTGFLAYAFLFESPKFFM